MIVGIMTINLLGRLSQNFTEKEINFERSSQTDPKVILERGKVKVKTRIPSPCVKKVKISEEQYNYFTSDQAPSQFKSGMWSKLKANEKLFFHLAILANGNTFSYEAV